LSHAQLSVAKRVREGQTSVTLPTAMEGGLSPDVIAALVTLCTLAGGTAVAAYAIRRARAARRRQIEGEDPPQRGRLREPTPEPDGLAPQEPETQLEPDDFPQAEGPRPGRLLEPPAPEPPALEPLPAGRGVQGPAVSLPLLGRRKDAAALVPGLQRTREAWVSRLGQIFSGKKEIDPGLVDEIEKVLLSADIGVRTSGTLIEEIRGGLGKRELKDPGAVWAFLRRRSTEMLTVDTAMMDFTATRPFVVLIIGVNGSGKTTTIGKLAAKIKQQGRSVLLVAGDTFRAAATEQLEIWGARVGVPVVRGKEGADPSSVIFDGIRRAKTDGIDVVLADTAGRLHTKANLMDELQKVGRVAGKAQEGAPHETWLVIDSTSGQNAIAQAQMFTQAMNVTGIVLTKLDGTAKGGVILGITDQLRIPVRFVGIGERVEDLREFDPEEFVEALLDQAAPLSPPP